MYNLLVKKMDLASSYCVDQTKNLVPNSSATHPHLIKLCHSKKNEHPKLKCAIWRESVINQNMMRFKQIDFLYLI